MRCSKLTLFLYIHMTPFLYNITFALDPRVESRFIIYLQNVFVPQLISDGSASSPLVAKVSAEVSGRAEEQDEAVSICLHLRFDAGKECLDVWRSSILTDALSGLRDRFGESVVWFPTAMQILNSNSLN